MSEIITKDFFLNSCIYLLFAEWALAAVSVFYSSCLSVFLSQGESQSSEELVHSHMDLRGEVVGEHDGHDHKDVVGGNLWKDDNHIDVRYMEFFLISPSTHLSQIFAVTVVAHSVLHSSYVQYRPNWTMQLYLNGTELSTLVHKDIMCLLMTNEPVARLETKVWETHYIMYWWFWICTLKLAGSTRRVKACSSLRLRRPPFRSSILVRASATPAIIDLPCFLTLADSSPSSGRSKSWSAGRRSASWVEN